MSGRVVAVRDSTGGDVTSIGYAQFLLLDSDADILLQQHHHHQQQHHVDVVDGLGTAVEYHSNATGGNLSEEAVDELYEGPEDIIVPIVFGLIFVVGVIGNGTLILTVLVNKTMRNTPNILLVSLALGDLCLILFTVPFMSTTYTFVEWPYGAGLCKLGEFIVALSLGVSVFTLTALSAERYMVIVHPMSAVHRGASSASIPTVLVAVGIWVVSVALGSVELVASHLSNDVLDGPAITVCYTYPTEWGEWYVQFHVVFRFVVYFAVPITVIAVFYALMARMLMVSTVQVPGDGVKGQAVKQVNVACAAFCK
jgi:bombesin-like receptor 3